MKKILIVIPSLEQGGGQKFVVDLANGIDKQEFAVKLLVYYARSESVFDKFIQQQKIDVVYLNKKPGVDFSLFKRVGRVIKDFKPDVIHSHLHSMLYLLPFYKKNQVKLHTVHTLAEKETGGMQGVVRLLSYKVKGVIPVGISHTVAKSISKRHKIELSNIPIVYNGVYCERYDIPHKKATTVRLVTVGTIYEVKNYSFLVDCFSEVCKEIDNIRLTIVGDGVLRNSLEEQIKKLGIEEKVIITGTVGDVENYLSDADIYVASSVFEGLPLSMLEAMAAGLPILSTNVGGVKDIINSEENGILVDAGDRDGYVREMKRLVLDEAVRHKLSKESKRISRNYDEKKTIAGYEELYLTALEKD